MNESFDKAFHEMTRVKRVVRLSYQKESNGSLKVLEENNYYPFGLKHKGYNNTNLANANYKYKYNDYGEKSFE